MPYIGSLFSVDKEKDGLIIHFNFGQYHWKINEYYKKVIDSMLIIIY